MKHSIKELYKLNKGKRRIYSAEAIKDIPVVRSEIIAKETEELVAYPIRCRTGSKPFRIYDKIGSKEFRHGYMYGYKAYFDSEEERNAHRLEVKKLEEMKKSNTFNLEGMSIRELKSILDTIDDDTLIEKGMFRLF